MRLSGCVVAFICLTLCPAWADPVDLCAKVGTDDTLKPYDPRLRPEFVRAYKHMFPKAPGTPSDSMLTARAVSRCLDGELRVCFIGEALPCTKIGKPGEPSAELDDRGFGKNIWTPLD